MGIIMIKNYYMKYDINHQWDGGTFSPPPWALGNMGKAATSCPIKPSGLALQG